MTKEAIYAAVGTKRQTHAIYWKRQARRADRLDGAEAQLASVRKDHPGLGLQKAWYMLRPSGISRHRFCEEMTQRGYALTGKRSFVRTTRSGSYRFANLIKSLIINEVNQVWQSDTTYYRINERFYYVTFIIDVYSRQIIGAYASENLLARANVAVLKQAITKAKGADLSGLIFHSDGGTQYRSKAFVDLLRQHGISSSMCDVALDNAYAERINGVIKHEYLDYWKPQNFAELKRQLRRAVKNYNQVRSHGGLPHRCSPATFTKRLTRGEAGYRYALLIKDGQAPNEALSAGFGQHLPVPGKYAGEGHGQMLPAPFTYFLPEQKNVVRNSTTIL